MSAEACGAAALDLRDIDGAKTFRSGRTCPLPEGILRKSVPTGHECGSLALPLLRRLGWEDEGPTNLAAAALRFVIYPTNEPEGDRAAFFRACAARWREQDVPVLFFHCSGIVLSPITVPTIARTASVRWFSTRAALRSRRANPRLLRAAPVATPFAVPRVLSAYAQRRVLVRVVRRPQGAGEDCAVGAYVRLQS